jgi:hypothetical protein
MYSNFSKIGVIYFTKKTNLLSHQYKLENSLLMRIDKDLGVRIDCKLHFQHQVDFIFAHALKFLGKINFRFRHRQFTDAIFYLGVYFRCLELCYSY